MTYFKVTAATRRAEIGRLQASPSVAKHAGWPHPDGPWGDNKTLASVNEEVAALLREYAELLGLTGGDQFRVRSYEKAAKAVAGYPDDLGPLPESALTSVPGVGKSVAAKVAEYRRTGTIKAVDELRATVPPGALLLAKVPGRRP